MCVDVFISVCVCVCVHRQATSEMYDAVVLVAVEKEIKAAMEMADPVLRQEKVDELKAIDRKRQELIKWTRMLYMDTK